MKPAHSPIPGECVQSSELLSLKLILPVGYQNSGYLGGIKTTNQKFSSHEISFRWFLTRHVSLFNRSKCILSQEHYTFVRGLNSVPSKMIRIITAITSLKNNFSKKMVKFTMKQNDKARKKMETAVSQSRPQRLHILVLPDTDHKIYLQCF